MDRGEIIQENRKFYCSTYIHMWNRVEDLLGISCVVISGIFIWIVRNNLLKYYYLRQASYEVLGDREVLDWVDGQVREHWLNGYTIALIGILLGVIVWGLFIRHGRKNYEYYKNRWLVSLLPVVLILILTGIFIGNMGGMVRDGEFAFAIVNLEAALMSAFHVLLLFSCRCLITIELRKDDNAFWRFMEWLADYELSKL